MRKDIAIFPYNKETSPYVEYFNIINRLEKVISIGISLTGLKNEMEEENIGLSVLSVEEMLSSKRCDWDELYILGEFISEKEDLSKAVTLLVNEADHYGKEVVLFNGKSNNFGTFRNKKKDILFCDTEISKRVHSDNIGSYEFARIERPVIFIGGMLNTENVTKITFRIKAELDKAYGIKTVGLLKNDYLGMENIYSYEKLLKCQKLNSFDDAVYRLNRFARDIIRYEQPDVILVELPSGIMKYSDTLVNSFGVETYIFAEALTPSHFIMDIPVQYAGAEMIKELSTYLYSRYKLTVSAICVSSLYVDSMDSMQEKKVSCVRLPKSSVETAIAEIVNRLDVPIRLIDDAGEIASLIGDSIICNLIRPLNIYGEENCAANDVDSIVEDIINKIRGKSENQLPNGWKDMDLCGEFFRFTAIDLIYLYFEIEKRLDIYISDIFVRDYGFNTYRKVCESVKQCMKDCNVLPKSEERSVQCLK